MTKCAALLNFTNVPVMLPSSQDDVIDNFLDMTSIYAIDSDIYVISVAAFTELKPYITLSIELDDITTETELAYDNADINDSNALKHVSCFKNLGKEYAGKNIHIELNAHWINPDGSKCTSSRPMDAAVSQFSAMEELKVRKPRASDGNQTKVLYGTYTAGATYDYKYPDNKKSQNTVLAMLPLEGELQFGEEWHPQAIDFSNGNEPKLYMLLSSGGAVSYVPAFDNVFTISDNKVTFCLPNDDWGAKIDISRLGSSTILDLYFSFTVKLSNEYYPKEHYTSRATVICKSSLAEDPMVKVEVIEPIYLYWDCVAESTLIKLFPDGEKPVSQLLAGDPIMDGEGKRRLVASCTSAPAEHIIRIETENGTVLEATDTHMLKTNTGFRKAGELTNCSYLLTKQEAGQPEAAESILSVKKVPYGGLVYRLELTDGSTFIGNGVISGDSKAVKISQCQWPDELLQTRTAIHQELVLLKQQI